MTVNLMLLFLAAFLPGLAMIKVKDIDSSYLQLILLFTGAYLFSITIVHIFPELYAATNRQVYKVGIYVLIGFFLQQVLEYFTFGVEHGHIHPQEHEHQHGRFTSLMVVIGLSLHAFFEGSLLVDSSTIHANHSPVGLLVGIVIHKIPASIALMSVLLCSASSKGKTIFFLVLFSIASPLGLLSSEMALKFEVLSHESTTLIFGIVSGNLLYISTIIFHEMSIDHHFNARKTIASLFGVLVAVLVEFFFN